MALLTIMSQHTGDQKSCCITESGKLSKGELSNPFIHSAVTEYLFSARLLQYLALQSGE